MVKHYDTGHFDIYDAPWLDKLVADQALDISILKEVAEGNF